MVAPLKILKRDSEQVRKEAMELLEIVGLSSKATQYPAQLSGGQKQRIAIAVSYTHLDVYKRQLLRRAGKRRPLFFYLLHGRFLFETDKHGSHMAIRACHTKALRCDGRFCRRNDLTVLNVSPQLQRLLFAFFFFAADERDVYKRQV